MGKKERHQYTEDLHDNIIANDIEFSGDYSNASLRSMKLVNCTFNNAKFNDAAVTGSKFDNCTFDDCEMDQSDFEYIDFFGCSLTSKHPIAISFNNSNFIDTHIMKTEFTSSTFTNAFFDEVEFSNVNIYNSTLEAVSFHHCHFIDTKLIDLNLDFSEFVDPDFHNSIFPQAQILNTFGLLQYMMSIKRPIELGDHNGKKTMDSDTYINRELPKLLNKYIESDERNMYGKKFPIINIFLAYKKKEEALYYLKKAFQEASLIDDLRMVRYYCKLVSFCGLFSLGERRKLYNDICSFFHMEIMSPWKLKNYSRQMGEIRYTLLMENNFPTLIFYAATNLVNECIHKVGTIMQHILTIAHKYKKSPMHDIKVEITHNSPIHLTIYFTETIENIAAMYKDLKNLSGAPLLENDTENKLSVQEYIIDDICHYLRIYSEQNITFRYIGHQIENWKQEYNNIFQIKG